jgi:hypothetical protein
MRPLIQKYNNHTVGFGILFFINIAIFYIAFGPRFLHPDDFLFTNSYDGIKNYYNYIYYTTIGSEWLEYTGMNYPFTDHVLFTDSTPVLGFFVKAFGLSDYAISIYNLFFIIPFLFASPLSYAIGRELDFKPLLNIVFALAVVWLHPMLFNMGEWVNLSMSIYFLLAIYIYILWFKNKGIGLRYLMSLFILIMVASFTHLYYLPLILFLIGPPMAYNVIAGSRQKAMIGLMTMLVGAVVVILFAKLSDPYASIRPTEVLGYNAPGLTCAWSDYLKSYECLSLPAFFKQENWNIEKLTFLGSAFPLTLLVAIVLIWGVVKEKNRSILSQHKLFTAIAFGSLVCYFTSLGTKLEVFNDSVRIYNFLNPLNIISEFSESAKNFRSMARFSLPAYTGLIICGFYVLNEFIKCESHKSIKQFIVAFICFIYLVDVYQMTMHTKIAANQPNIFDEAHNASLPEIDISSYNALLPLPYYHVGTEKKGWIIDDNNFWSRETYRRALYYKLPLMACKLSRTPLYTAEQLFSLFSGSPDPQIMNLLKGKKVLICVDTIYKKMNIDTEPAKTIAVSQEQFLEQWQPTFLLEKDGVKYYELFF